MPVLWPGAPARHSLRSVPCFRALSVPRFFLGLTCYLVLLSLCLALSSVLGHLLRWSFSPRLQAVTLTPVQPGANRLVQ